MSEKNKLENLPKKYPNVFTKEEFDDILNQVKSMDYKGDGNKKSKEDKKIYMDIEDIVEMYMKQGKMSKEVFINNIKDLVKYISSKEAAYQSVSDKIQNLSKSIKETAKEQKNKIKSEVVTQTLSQKTQETLSKMQDEIDTLGKIDFFNSGLTLDEINLILISLNNKEKVTYIGLSECGLSGIPDFKNFPNLQNINLSENNLTDEDINNLPSKLSNKNIDYINLGFNNISNIGKGFDGLGIKRINLSHNKLNSLKGIEKLSDKTIYELIINDNKITNIDELLKNGFDIQGVLDISNNNIKKLYNKNTDLTKICSKIICDNNPLLDTKSRKLLK